jgi:hypothetical protein
MLVLALLVVPLLLVAILKGTRWFGLPGATLVACGVATLTVWPFETGHGEEAVMNGLANLVHVAIALGLLVLGAITWAVAARRQSQATRSSVVLPKATAVAGGSER